MFYEIDTIKIFKDDIRFTFEDNDSVFYSLRFVCNGYFIKDSEMTSRLTSIIAYYAIPAQKVKDAEDLYKKLRRIIYDKEHRIQKPKEPV